MEGAREEGMEGGRHFWGWGLRNFVASLYDRVWLSDQPTRGALGTGRP